MLTLNQYTSIFLNQQNLKIDFSEIKIDLIYFLGIKFIYENQIYALIQPDS
jgi:hypothetical protein